jgi:hypothetical protein
MQRYTVYFIWKLLYMFRVVHVEQFPDKINCVTLHIVGYILEYASDTSAIVIVIVFLFILP